MEDQIVIKPIGWRYYLRNFLIFLIGVALGLAMSIPLAGILHKPFPTDSMLILYAMMLPIAALVAWSNSELFDIVISNGYLSGPKVNSRKEQIFYLNDFDQRSFEHRTLWEKIEGYYTLRSHDGARIKFTPYIYGEEQAQKLRQILEHRITIEDRS